MISMLSMYGLLLLYPLIQYYLCLLFIKGNKYQFRAFLVTSFLLMLVLLLLHLLVQCCYCLCYINNNYCKC